MRIARIYLQPVKSLRGHEVSEARLDALGFVDDRRFLVVDPQGKFLTQRSVPRMATVAARVDAGALELSQEGRPRGRFPLAGDAAVERRAVSIWKSEGLSADDCGPAAAAWLSAALEIPCRLVRVGAAFDRPIPVHRVPAALTDRGQAPRVAFPDAFPFMVLGESTLDDLNRRLRDIGEGPFEMERFRPSFTIEGSPAYAEDRWPVFRIGAARFHAAGPCARCIVPNLDPWTGAGGHEPLRLLSGYRRDPADSTRVNFGQNVVHEPAAFGATIRVGDAVEPD